MIVGVVIEIPVYQYQEVYFGFVLVRTEMVP
jgi:hypothetical protein